MTDQDLDVVVLNWKTAELSADCARVARGALPGAEIYVVDNGSGDGSPAKLREALPGDHVIETDRNLGFGGGMNAGIAAGRRPYVLLLNSDARPVGDAFSRLLAHCASDPRLAVVTPATIDDAAAPVAQMTPEPAAWELVLSCAPVLWRLVNSQGYFPEGQEPITLEWFPTLCVALFRREAIDGIGRFDPAYFLGWEEWDLTRRLHQRGWKIASHPGAQVVHAGWGSTPKELKPWRLKHSRLSILRHLRKYHGPVWHLLGKAASALSDARVVLRPAGG